MFSCHDPPNPPNPPLCRAFILQWLLPEHFSRKKPLKKYYYKKVQIVKNYKNLPWKNYVMCYYSYKHFYVQNCSQVRIFQSRVNILLKSFWIIFWSVDRFDNRSANNCLCFSKCISNCYVRNYFSCQNMLELPIKYCIFFLLNSSSGGDGKIKIYWIEITQYVVESWNLLNKCQGHA